MKNLPNTIISLIIGATVGSAGTYYLTSNQNEPFTESTSTPETPKSKIAQKGNDKYEIRWYGKPKNKYWGGSYTIMKPDAPIEFVEIPKSPHVVKIQLPQQSVVAAGGNVQDIKIFKNGKECGKTGIVGKGIPVNKSCQPEL